VPNWYSRKRAATPMMQTSSVLLRFIAVVVSVRDSLVGYASLHQ